MILRLEKIRVIDICMMYSTINLNPPYQRASGIWNKHKQEELIDTIVNSLDIPKFYFSKSKNNIEYEYNVIDGKQRLEAIIAFYTGKIKLNLLKINAVKFDFNIGDKDFISISYDELKNHSSLYQRFINFELHIMVIEEWEDDEVESFFIRLNSGVPLIENEIRYAINTSINNKIKDLSKLYTQFFAFSDLRKYHYDTVLKMFFLFDILNKDKNINSIQSLSNKNLKDFISNNPYTSISDFENILNRYLEKIKQYNINGLLKNRNNLIVFFAFTTYHETENEHDIYAFIEKFHTAMTTDKLSYIINYFKMKSQQNTTSKNSILTRIKILDIIYNKCKISSISNFNKIIIELNDKEEVENILNSFELTKTNKTE